MSTGFAGSRSMDERRRRRLASESIESLDDSNDDSASQTIARTHRFAAGQFPLRTLIFPRRWKLCFFYLPVFLCFAGLIAADFYRPEFSTPDSAIFNYFSLEQSSLPRYLSGGLLFVSGQLALLIAALRTQSLHDFSGRYRLWKWVAAGLFLFALCATTQVHHVWASTVIEQRLFDWGSQTQLLAWLVPALLFGLTVSLMTYLEMRGDRAGLNFTIMAAAAYVASLTFMLTGNLIPWEEYHHLIAAGIMFFAHWCLFTSLLLHVHHLLYQSIDLPEKVPSRFKKVCATYLHRRRIKRKAKRVAKAIRQKERLAEKAQQLEAKKALAEAEVSDSAEKQSAAPQPPKAVTTPKPTAKDTKGVPTEQTQAPVAKNKAAKNRSSQKQQPKTEKKNIRVDSSHDPELLKGLSKRERRKLQKQWREEERLKALQNEEHSA
ncbi:hypothetical protein Pan241w_33870 [Gimesia alba]|uniref:Uncharacterized protein n=1 Tax=Gimesia alba TaxID=2527973 RepID=A0A517RHC8_9PLAN|nr:hypothetical protein [Gimesia alba]QDT43287.1 hypothetical protein Pan241w_33870 [Gimesia alba]